MKLRPSASRSLTVKLGGKWFATTAENAKQWGDVMNGVGNSIILKVDIAADRFKNFMTIDRLDGIGAAAYGELKDLAGAAISVLK